MKYYSIEEIETMMQKNETKNPRNEYFNKELKTIIEYYKKEKMLSSRIIKPVQDEYIEKSIELVEEVFTEAKDKEEGKLVKNLVKRIQMKMCCLQIQHYSWQLDQVEVNI